MSKKINTTTISRSMVNNFRLFLYPAEKELNFWKGINDTFQKEMEEISVLTKAEMWAVRVLTERISSELSYWEGVQKERNQAIKALIPDSVYNVLGESLNEDSLKDSTDFYVEWFKYLGIELTPDLVNALRKAVTEIGFVTDSILKVNRGKDSLQLKGKKTIKVILIFGLIKWLAYGRKQFEITGTYLEPVFRLRTF